MDAFGQKPYYEDRGLIRRAILAIGKQDADTGSMTPVDSKIDILGASSDHLIMDVTRSDHEYQVGDIVSFTLGYGGLLKAATSAYVDRNYVGRIIQRRYCGHNSAFANGCAVILIEAGHSVCYDNGSIK